MASSRAFCGLSMRFAVARPRDALSLADYRRAARGHPDYCGRTGPAANANIAILNYADVMRRFMLNQSFSINDLDTGVRECVLAKIGCRGFEITQSQVHRQRMGNVVLDVLGFQRETHTEGWRFNGLILIKDDVVVYKLTGGQPVIQQKEENQNPLGPVQAIGSKMTGISF